MRFARNASSGCIRKSLEAAHSIVYQQSVWPTIDGIVCGRLSVSGTRWCGNTNAPLTTGSPKRGPMAKTHCAVTHQSGQGCASRKFPAKDAAMLHFLFDGFPVPPCAEPLPPADPIFPFVCFMTAYLIFLAFIPLRLPASQPRPITLTPF